MARRRIRGDRAFKRLIRKMPDAIRAQTIEMLDEAGDELLLAQQGAATVSQRVRGALRKRVLPGALQLKVGILGRPMNRRLWWARVIEKGRKASTEDVTRRTKSGRISRYAMRVPALAARPFVYSDRAEAVRRDLGGRVQTFWEKVLRRAGQGVGDG